MHAYLRAIGFSKLTDRKKLKEILTDAIMTADRRAQTMTFTIKRFTPFS